MLLEYISGPLKFKTDYISDKEIHVGEGNLRRRKRKTLLREDQILLLVREFDHLEGTFTFELNSDAFCVDFARKIGSVGKEHDLSEPPRKRPGSSQNEQITLCSL